MNLLKQAQDLVVVQETAKLFFARSINEVTIKDIATAVGIGEATIYRRYTNKYNLVLSVANYLQSDIQKRYYNFNINGNGFSKIEKFYKSFLNIYNENPSYYKFINEFDAFVLTNNSKDMLGYEEGVAQFKLAFDKIYQEGLKDGSIKPVDNIDSFYFATTHALLGLCKKLADKDVLQQDKNGNKVGEIKVLIETILYRLK